MAKNSYLNQIRAELAQEQEFLEGLQSGKLYYGHPSDGRTEAKIFDLHRKIAEHQAILNRHHALRP
jgi:hypothetical protein